ncbi:RNA polymerase sigma factor [uncultured Paraglaciecola sp.]|uniref:RNA polymerase sigma factor n=1 Tax=uncultured Paraglaciecola sp. TaxID=1765024 RepID=UPI0030DC9503|tara:strand:- start:10256 stop:10762 length:507 start_codon:yes stop_codon:yes gene_type:complete
MLSIERIYTLYKDRILAFFITKRIDRDKAEDLTQDVFLRYHKANYDVDENAVKSLLFRIAKNIFIDYLRSLKTSLPQNVVVKNNADNDDEQEFVDETVDIPRSIDAQKELTSVIAMLQLLPPKCRDVFIDFRFRSLSQTEIAKRHNISLSMVEKHVSTALERLKTRKS